MKKFVFSLIVLAALLTGCAKKEEVSATPPEGPPVAGTAGNAAPGAPPATLNGGAAVGPDGKPLTGAGK
ncbi:hypothetical protein [Armatimonas sp.]|uniref:lipoprotein n=1 Tax=Armatimonas sp. TaxID=1872638 RepID=UPI00286B58DA|nr:hypothetical protein [Armatimonas sp.]